MQYTITMVTFETALKTEEVLDNNGKYRPNLGKDGFSDATVTQFQIEDDDPGLNYIRPGNANLPAEDQQGLLHDLNFGAGDAQGVLAAGTQISAYHATIIQDEEGNKFNFLFLWKVNEQGGLPIKVGEGHSAIILPIPHQDVTGQKVWPQFNPSANFIRVGYTGVGSDNPTLPLDPTGPGDPPCFTPGTLIETPAGPVPVEQLCIGDLVCTRDHGPQPLRWTGSTLVNSHRLDLQPNLRPVLIPAGALAAGVPARDLLVSPQHRVLVRSRIAMRMFAQTEVLVAAKHLLGLNGISAQNPSDGVTYLHLLFDRHEVIRSNGAWSESFFIGPQMIKAGDRAVMAEIAAIFPDLPSPPPARRFLSGRESRQLALRHAKNNRELVSSGA